MLLVTGIWASRSDHIVATTTTTTTIKTADTSSCHTGLSLRVMRSSTGKGMGKLSSLVLTLPLLATFCLQVEAFQTWYYLIPSTRTWDEAQEYCQDNYIDMATMETLSGSWLGDWMIDYGVTKIWVGLHRDPVENAAWRWINLRTGVGLTGDDLVSHVNWAVGEPATGDCGWFEPVERKWKAGSCTEEMAVLCFNDNLRVVKENKTWEEALSHCRNLGIQCSSEPCSDLLTLTKDEDYTYVSDRINRAKTTDEAWTGLHFAAGDWWGTDGKSLNHKMSPDCPSPLSRCGIVSRNTDSSWDTGDCAEKKHFVCFIVIG